MYYICLYSLLLFFFISPLQGVQEAGHGNIIPSVSSVHSLSNHKSHARKITLASHTIDTSSAPSINSILSQAIKKHSNEASNDEENLEEVEHPLLDEEEQFFIQYSPNSHNLKSLRETIESIDAGFVHFERYIPHHSFLVYCTRRVAIKISKISEVSITMIYNDKTFFFILSFRQLFTNIWSE